MARQAESAQRVQAERRSAQIEKVNEILGSIFKDINPKRAEREGKPLEAMIRESLDRAMAQIEGDSIGEPLTVARMQWTLGRSQLGLGDPDKAIGLIEKARATFTSLLGPDHPDTLATMNDLALGLRDSGQIDRALALLEEVMARRRAKLNPGRPAPRIDQDDLAVGRRDDGRIDRATPLLKEELASGRTNSARTTRTPWPA